MPFKVEQKILFKHCDPAGIVFYPRYFEMINDCVEVFFDKAVQWPFEKLLDSGGVPTVSISTNFSAPSRHGDVLDLNLSVARLGRTSIDLLIQAVCKSEIRFDCKSTLVRVNKEGKPSVWPDLVRQKLESSMEIQQ